MGIGQNLKTLRSKTRYSQQDMADLLDIERKTYANWESGNSDVKSEHIPKLADIFGVEIQELFKKTPSEITITQQNIDNKDSSVNYGIVILVQDEDSVQQLVKVLKDTSLGKASD